MNNFWSFCYFFPAYFCSVTGTWSTYFFLSTGQRTQNRRQHRTDTSVGLC